MYDIPRKNLALRQHVCSAKFEYNLIDRLSRFFVRNFGQCQIVT